MEIQEAPSEQLSFLTLKKHSQADIWRELQNFTATQYCEVVGNPMGGFSHFDNFWGAVLSLSQVFVPDSSYDVWNRAKVSYLHS